MELRDLCAHLCAHSRVKIERFVEQEDLGLYTIARPSATR